MPILSSISLNDPTLATMQAFDTPLERLHRETPQHFQPFVHLFRLARKTSWAYMILGLIHILPQGQIAVTDVKHAIV